jgi:hypothetical protein
MAEMPSLGDILGRVLDKGLVIAGDSQVNQLREEERRLRGRISELESGQ